MTLSIAYSPSWNPIFNPILNDAFGELVYDRDSYGHEQGEIFRENGSAQKAHDLLDGVLLFRRAGGELTCCGADAFLPTLSIYSAYRKRFVFKQT